MTFVVLAAHQAQLRSCRECSFLFVDDPTWLEGSFDSRLHRMDVGSVDRSMLVARYVRGLVWLMRERELDVLDIGGGDGFLVRQLRDSGINARYSDPFAEPVVDVGEPVTETDCFDLGLMSEVALHFTDPVEAFGRALEQCESVLFTAVVPPVPVPSGWWYLMPDTGQHVAFYTPTAISRLAAAVGGHATSDGAFFHMISRRPIPKRTRIAMRWRAMPLLVGWIQELIGMAARARGRGSPLTVGDQQRVSRELRSGRVSGDE